MSIEPSHRENLQILVADQLEEYDAGEALREFDQLVEAGEDPEDAFEEVCLNYDLE